MTTHVAIIGAGLSGLTLALALHQHFIPCTLYEARSAPLDIGGAIMLSPNALRILDSLNVYQSIRTQGHEFNDLHFRTEEDSPLDSYEFGSEEKYGYRALRIYRNILIRELSTRVQDAGVPILYNRKFSTVIEETCSTVTWSFDDGSTGIATVLVGADGIHSKVRKYLYPDLEPVFTKAMGVSAAVPMAQLNLPPGYNLPTTIMNRTHGAFVIAPQKADGSEVFIGRQKRAPELDRDGWNALLNDKEWCVEYLRKDISCFPAVARNAVSDIQKETINLWPFYVVPKLERWSSSSARVVILGDAAHAIPPTAGQGINQAFEDVFTFALIFGRVKEDFQRGLKIWQKGRQERVDRVLALNAQIDKRRMPRDPLDQEEHESFELGWLYGPDFGEMVEGWLAGEGL